MKEQSRIPTSKVQRASKFVSTGAKVGINYLKYYAKGGKDRASLDAANAEDIYDSLSNLKGSALKMAQVLSMDQGILPEAYTQKFALAQYSAPPLSLPLVVKTFREELGKSPFDLFENFSRNAINAASMGQVHSCYRDGKKLAIKVQYPGVSNSIESDLNLIKPIATRIIGMKGADIEQYFQEVKERLLEEADYELELRRSMELSQQLQHLEGLSFPTYFPEFSSRRIITMEWISGMHMGEFLKTNPSQELRNQLGQRLWDFYNFQLHQLKAIHADPHPGNFLFNDDGTLGIIDFGCVKELPLEFYHNYFALLDEKAMQNETAFEQQLGKLQMLFPEDSEQDKTFFKRVLRDSVSLLSEPLNHHTFDFGDEAYINRIYQFGQEMGNNPQIRKTKKARGPKDALFVNRTFFGIYNILHQLNATITPNWGYKATSAA